MLLSTTKMENWRIEISILVENWRTEISILAGFRSLRICADLQELLQIFANMRRFEEKRPT